MWSNFRNGNTVRNHGMRFWVRCRTTEIMLGTAPSDPDIHREFIASKAPTLEKQEEEVAAVQMAVSGLGDDERENWLTVFPVSRFFVTKDQKILDPAVVDVEGMEGEYKVIPFIHAYQIRGSFKESISMLTKAAGGKKAAKEKGDAVFAAANISAYKKAVDGGWFVTTPKIPLRIPETYEDTVGRTVNTFDQNGRLHYITRPLRCETAKGPRVCLASSEFVPAGTEFMFQVHLLNADDFKSFVETMDLKAFVGMLQWRGGGKGTLEWTICDEEGDPYESYEWDGMSDDLKNMIDTMNDAVEGIVQPIGYVHTKKASRTVEAAPKKRGRKKADEEAESTEETSTEETAEAPVRKKRGRKSKAEKEAEAAAAAAEAMKKEDDTEA